MRIGFIGSNKLFNADKGEGGGAPSASDLVERYKDALKIAEKLSTVMSENHDYREQLRQAKAELETAKKLVPADGSVILTAEQGKAWESYQQLGKPDDLKAERDELQTARGEIKKTTRDRTMQQAAGATTINGKKVRSEVLARLLPDDAKVTVDKGSGDEGETAMIEVDGKPQKLADYLQREHAVFVPSLIASEQGEQRQQERKQQPQRRANNGDGKAQTKVASNYVAGHYVRPGQKEQ